MINQKLLVSGADFFADDYQINPYYGTNQISLKKAKKEHAEIITYFREANIEIIQVPAPKDCQDGVYVANWALVHGNTAIMSSLPNTRQPEEAYAKKTLENLGYKTLHTPTNNVFSGQGDSLICGNYLFAGSSYRSSETAQRFVAETFKLELVQLRAKPKLSADSKPFTNPVTGLADSFFYDLDLALAVINENTIAYCPEAFTPESQTKLANVPINKIIVDYTEASEGFACNLVSTGKHVIMSSNAPKLQTKLEKLDLTIFTPEITELKKGGGYIRCISLTL